MAALKYLVLLLVLAVVLGPLLARWARGGAALPRRKPQPPQRLPMMVSCAHCGLHLPSADAVVEGERHYCGAAHRALGPRAP